MNTPGLHPGSLLLLALVAAGCRSPAGQREVGVVAPSVAADWTFTDVRAIPSGKLPRWASAASWRDTAYFVANVLPVHETTVGARPVVLLATPGGPIDLPSGEFQFAYPKIAIGPSGELHLVWAEFASARPDVVGWFDRQASLWHAVRRKGVWSTPQKVLASPLDLTPDAGHLAVDSHGILHVAVWGIRNDAFGITYLRRSVEGNWKVSSIGFVSITPVAAVTVAGDSVLIGFVDDGPASTDSARMSVAITRNDGASWTIGASTPLAGRIATHPEFIHRGGTLLLVWGEKAQGRSSIDSLRVARPGPGGTLRVSSIALPRGANSFSVANSPCGEALILVGAAASPTRVFEYVLGQQRDSLAALNPIAGDRQSAFATAGLRGRDFVSLLSVIDPGSEPKSVIASRPSCSTLPRGRSHHPTPFSKEFR